jgi:hypothetical protein
MDDAPWLPSLSNLAPFFGEPTQQAKRRSPKKKQDIFPLVDEDGLFFCIISARFKNATHTGLPPVGKAFRQAFNQVWEQIREADRLCMLNYWDEPMIGSSLPFRPLIQLVIDRYPLPQEARFISLGNELNFWARSIREHDEPLPREIARMLADVHHVASRAHWGLTLKYLDEPMKQWEALPENRLILLLKEQAYEDLEPDVRQRIDLIDAAGEQKYKELVAQFRPRHDAAIAAILNRWGFDDEARQNENVGQRSKQ